MTFTIIFPKNWDKSKVAEYLDVTGLDFNTHRLTVNKDLQACAIFDLARTAYLPILGISVEE